MTLPDRTPVSPLRPVSRTMPQFDAMAVADRLVQGGARIAEPDGRDAVVAAFEVALAAAAGSPTALHGHRTQRLFKTIVTDLDRVVLVKEEDAGDLIAGENVQAPDYRIVLEDGRSILAEVKNFHPNDPLRPFTMRSLDRERLERYAGFVGCDGLWLGIYWARWNLWTMTDLDVMIRDGDRYTIDLPAAMKANRLVSIGDHQIGVEWPLTFKLISHDPQPVDPETGGAKFTVGAVELAVAGQIISDEREQQIAYELMLFGSWDSSQDDEVVDGRLRSITFISTPHPENRSQPFALVGWVSSLISARVNAATLDERGSVTSLEIPSPALDMPSLIPDDYEGQVLKIWRFRLEPS